MSRWITVRQPFDFHWPSRAITAFGQSDLREHLVKDELADFAVDGGYATEGKVDGSARSRKGTGQRATGRRRRKGANAAQAADSGSDDAMAQPDMADADWSAGGKPVDSDAG